MSIFTKAWEFVTSQFAQSPAEWTTALLIFATLVFSIFVARNDRKKLILKLEHLGTYANGRERYEMRVTNNSGTRSVDPRRWGFKRWDGTLVISKTFSGERGDQLASQAQMTCLFYDNEDQEEVDIDPEEIYYLYVEDSTGRVYRKYTYFPMVSWAIRFFRFLRSIF